MTTKTRSKVQAIADYFGLNAYPRFSINFPHADYALIVSRHEDRFRMVVGSTGAPAPPSGTHLNMTRRQAETLRDGLTRLLADERDTDA